MKDFSSSTILFHQKKHHSDMPFQYTPDHITCNRCYQSIAISAINLHYTSCENRLLKYQKSSPHIIDEYRALCNHCNRKFALDRIEKHQQACENLLKKRPLFDMLKKRMPFLAETYKKMSTKRSTLNLNYPNSKWQQQHLELLRNLKGIEEKDPYEDLVKCKYCEGKFAPSNIDKHIRICKKLFKRVKKSKLSRRENTEIYMRKVKCLTVKTPSENTLWRPVSVNQRNNDYKRHDKLDSISFQDLDDNENILETSESPPKIRVLRSEFLEPIVSRSESKALNIITCPTCNKKFFSTIADKHIITCLKKYLKPCDDKGKKHVKNQHSYGENQLKTPEITKKAKNNKKIKNKTKEKRRSSSTQPNKESTGCCNNCGAFSPAKAKFCMMCGIVLSN
ncbi:hypothetical protein SteCoe_16174 [Stentor coeruleus]|uniref:C2HC/C3H-type domain-containing protein n=1 Tax=Stentor coeruleus TaxID=5963 RepID=A0A1R2C1W8_9CILI|nr:hypothetical protein SteCoe_16174 [Stentor coeruleus]